MWETSGNGQGVVTSQFIDTLKYSNVSNWAKTQPSIIFNCFNKDHGEEQSLS